MEQTVNAKIKEFHEFMKAQPRKESDAFILVRMKESEEDKEKVDGTVLIQGSHMSNGAALVKAMRSNNDLRRIVQCAAGGDHDNEEDNILRALK